MKLTISRPMKPFLVLKCEVLIVLRMRQHEKTARLTKQLLKPHKKSKLKLIIPKQSFRLRKRMRPKRMGLELCKRIRDRKSTRLNSSHDQISYAVFCLKKKKKKKEKRQI